MDRETIQTLLDLLNPLHGSLDRQIHDERMREELESPRDREWAVNVTEGEDRDLTQAVLILEDRFRQGGQEAALEKARWDADSILGEFHGFLYDLIEKAEKAGDGKADALLTYVHDQFIPYRTRARGEEAKRDFAKEPSFQPSN